MATNETRAFGRRIASGVCGIALASAAWALPGAAAAQTIVMVIDPPTNETNRYWDTGGDFGLNPAMQPLVGQHPETAEYDASGVARAWEHNEDFTTWTFHLHEDAEFHFDWGPVTAADIVHSYEWHTQDESTLSGVEQMRGAELEIIDDHTVAFHLPEPRPNYLFAVAHRGSIHIYSKAQFDEEGLEGYDARPAGTGQLQYVEREIGRGVVFEKVENHWSGEDALYDVLDLRFVLEPATKLAMLLSGEAQVVNLPRELHGEALDAGYEIVYSAGPAMQTAWFLPSQFVMPDEPDFNPDLPWHDVRIREAINRAVDRDAVIDILYDGRADKLVQFTMDPRHEGWNQDLADRFDEMYGFDPERARELVAEAGYPENFDDPVIPITMTVMAGNPEFTALAELMDVFLSEVGLQTEIRETDWATVANMRRARSMFATHPMRNAPVRPTEIGINAYFYSGGRPVNIVEHPEVEALYPEYRASLDPDERDALAQEIFQVLFENYFSIPIASVNAAVAVDPEQVAGWTFPGVTSIGLSHFHLIEPAS